MISGIVPFEEIVQSVKDETGIENIRPYYEKIRRFIFRAEREIGYGGSVALFKKTYLVAGITNIDPNFGKYFKFPEDFIEFEGVGQKCQLISEKHYRATSEGLRFREKQTVDTVMLYWGLSVDDNGYPFVTRNHEEAVVAYIVWKLYSSKVFLGMGNMNAVENYKRIFELAVGESRGDDAFPTLEQWNALGQLSYTDRRILLDQPVHSYDYCAEYEDEIINDDLIKEKMIKYWQAEFIQNITELIPLITNEYLEGKSEDSLEKFEQGKAIGCNQIARICFAITETEDNYYSFKDFMGNNINSAFNSYYFEALKVKLYVSKNMISYSTMTFKIENL